MPERDTSELVCALRRAGLAADVSDAELLRRFATCRDPAAFELIVWRHAAMVRGACRQVLRDEATADDAFQAAFVVLLRKAASVRSGSSLAGWLHRVALRVALRARPARPTSPLPDEVVAPTAAAGIDAETARILHEEIDRLPDHYRDVVAVCFLEGHTREAAASLLGCPAGTVSGRMDRAKAMLRRRLSSRGVDASALAAAPTAAGVTSAILDLVSTSGASAGPRALALAEGVIRAMFLKQISWAAAAAVVIVVTAGVGLGTGEPARTADDPKPVPADMPAARADKDKPPVPRPSVVFKAVKREVTPYSTFTGATEAAKTVKVWARVDGNISVLHVKEGDAVKAGRMLFEIEDRAGKADFRRAESRVVSAEARLDRAQAEFARAKKLAEAGTLTKEELLSASHGVAEGRAEVRAAAANLDEAKRTAESAQGTASTEGRIDGPLPAVGTPVKAGDAVCTITDRATMRVTFDVDERTALAMRRAALKEKSGTVTVGVNLLDEADYSRQAKVDRIGDRVDPKSRTLAMSAVLPNADGLIVPGMTVKVRLATGKPFSALFIPKSAVRSVRPVAGGKMGEVLAVNDANVARKAWVALGREYEDAVEVTEGLKEGEGVLLSPPAK